MRGVGRHGEVWRGMGGVRRYERCRNAWGGAGGGRRWEEV